jgi:hypothetical protein
MSPTAKARTASTVGARKKPLEASRESGPAQRELEFLIIGGIALVEGIALILLARRKI